MAAPGLLNYPCDQCDHNETRGFTPARGDNPALVRRDPGVSPELSLLIRRLVISDTESRKYI